MDFIKFSPPREWGFSSDLIFNINFVAREAFVVPCALGAIVMRESSGQNILQLGADEERMRMPDGSRPGVGLSQITWGVDWSRLTSPEFHGIARPGVRYRLWDQRQNLECASYEFMRPARVSAFNLRGLYPGYGQPWLSNILYLEFAIYNAGERAVGDALASGQSPDDATTDNYAKGVNELYQAALVSSHHGN